MMIEFLDRRRGRSMFTARGVRPFWLSTLSIGSMLIASAAHAQAAPAQPDTSQSGQVAASGEAPTQPDDAGPVGLEDIVVTGRKRANAELLQETPLAATAFAQAELESAKVVSAVDVGRMVPGVSFQSSSQTSTANFSIRGTGTTGSNQSDEPTVGVFVNGIYLGVNAGGVANIYDVGSIEVLRGPQGTLFGRNVTGGAILIGTRRPDMEFNAKLSASYGTGDTIELAGVLNAPLVEDKAAFRLAVQRRHTDGLFDNIADGQSYGRANHTLIRPTLLLKPTPDLTITLIGEYFKYSGDPVPVRGISPSAIPGKAPSRPTQLGFVSPADYFDLDLDTHGYLDLETRFAILQADWDVGPGVVSFVGGIRDVANGSETDFDGSPFNFFISKNSFDQDQRSAELRYAGSLNSWVDFTVGAYYFEQDYVNRALRTLDAGVPQAEVDLLQVSSYAFFGEADIKLSPELTLTVGGRYTSEEKEARVAVYGQCQIDHTNCNFGPRKFYDGNNFSPKVGASYEVTSDNLVYASFTKGYRSGGYSLRGAVLGAPYQAEKATAYEIGSKNDFFDHRLRLNIAAYHNKFKDLQRTVIGVDPINGTVQQVFNAASATIDGVEVELLAQLSRELKLSAVYGYTHARYQSYRGLANPGARRFVRVPAHTGSVSLSYEKELEDASAYSARVSANYADPYYFDDPNLLRQNAYALVDARIGYTLPGGNVTMSAFGRNLTNSKYAFWGSDLGARGENRFIGEPRTFGVQFEWEFR